MDQVKKYHFPDETHPPQFKNISIMRSLFFYTILLFCFTAVLISGCKKDLVNSNKKLPEHFTIELPGEELTLIRGLEGADSIKARIKIPGQSSVPFDTAAYSFIWTSLSNGDTLSQKPYLIPGDFDGLPAVLNSVLLTVKEKKTGIVELATSSVSITTPTREGWMILGEKAGAAQLGMLTYTTQGYKKFVDLAAELGKNISLSGKPVCINAIGSDIFFGLSVLQWVGITTDQEIKVLQSMDFVVDQNISNFLTNTFQPSPANPVKLEKTGYTSFTANKGNDLFFSSLFYLKYMGLMMTQQLNVLNGQPFHVSNVHTYVGPGRGPFDYNRLVYDLDQYKFRWVPDDGLHDLTLQTPFAMDGFQLYAIQNKMSEPGEESLILSLLHNPVTQQSYMLQFLTNGIVKETKQIAYADAADIIASRFIEIDHNTGYIIYVKGNKVMAYDYTIGQTFMLLDMGNESISMMKFEKYNQGFSKMPGRVEVYDELFKRLVVCTYDATSPDNSGKFRLYQLPLGHQAPVLEMEEAGFPKIVDASFVPIH